MRRQLTLFEGTATPCLPIHVERDGTTLAIPEGLDTIPFTHGLHRFPGKFIPHLCRFFFRLPAFSDRHRIVMDPFCGSGTTLVEAALDGRPFLGIDIDPLGVLIAKAKTNPLSEADVDRLMAHWANHDFSADHPTLVPKVDNLSHWFSDAAIRELASIKARSLELTGKLRDYSLVVFSSLIRRVSNADDQTQKTYVSHTLPKKPPLPSALFHVFLARAVEGMRRYVAALPSKPEGRVLHGDARVAFDTVSFDDVITSPPYIDSIDYIYNQMLEYFWLLPELGLATQHEIRALRKEPMGHKRYEQEATADFARIKLGKHAATFETLCRRIAAASTKEALAVRGFFFDFAAHLAMVRAKQAKGGHYICVIGNSHIRGVTIPTVRFMAALFENSGYRVVDEMEYEIRRHYMKFPRRSNSRKIKRDHILVCEAL